MILQHIYVPVFNWIYNNFTNKISGRVVSGISSVLFFMIFLFQYISSYTTIKIIDHNIRDYLVFLFLLVIVIISINCKVQLLKWRWYIYVPFVLFALWILIIGRMHKIGDSFTLYPLLLLFVLIPLFFIYGNRGDYSFIFKNISRGYLLFFSVIVIICVTTNPYYPGCWRFMDDGLNQAYIAGYFITNINPNGFAKIILPAFACGLYMIIQSKRLSIISVYAVATGFAGYITFISQCKYAIICEVLIAIIAAIVLSREKEHREVSVKKVLLIVFIVISSMFVMAFLLQVVSPKIVGAPTAEAYNDMVDPHVGADADGKDYVHTNETVDHAIPAQDTFISQMDDILGGRLQIWLDYCYKISLTGDGFNYLYVKPHNIYIEYSCIAGLPAGVIWLIFTILTGVIIAIGFIRDAENMQFPLYCFIIFFIVSMLDTGINPFNRGFLLMYLITIAPTVCEK